MQVRHFTLLNFRAPPLAWPPHPPAAEPLHDLARLACDSQFRLWLKEEQCSGEQSRMGLGTYHCFKVCHTEFLTSCTQVLCATRAMSPQIRKVSTVCTCLDFIRTCQQLVQRTDDRLLTRTKIWKISPWSLQHKAVLFHFHGSFNSTHSGGSLKTWNAFKWSTTWKVIKAANSFEFACSQLNS